jgi:hypothetical protein
MYHMINLWHTRLAMPKYDAAWHRADMRDELAEYHAASGLICRWSEASDVVYTYTRGRWSGHKSIEFPLSRGAYYVGLVYMVPKYTLRWLFFRKVARSMGAPDMVTEVRNPRKVHKLKDIAERNGLEAQEFTRRAQALMKWWPLLP